MADPTLPALVSTVNENAAVQVAAIASAAQASEGTPGQLAANITPSVQALLSYLATNGTLSEKDAIKQLADTSPDLNTFVEALQKSIVNAKEGTPQGLLLAAQLASGAITQAQFAAAVNAIVIPAAQLQVAVSKDLNVQLQKLLLSLSNNPDLNTLAKLVSAKTDAILAGDESVLAKIAATTADAAPAPIPALPTEPNTDAAAAPAPQLVSEFKDETLSFLQNLFAVAAAIAAQNLAASASSLISLNPQPAIMSGARAVLKLNGHLMALATNVSYEINTDWAEIKGVDELIPNDLAPQAFSVKGNFTLYRTPNGSPIGKFLQQDMFRGIIWPYTTIEIRDKRTDELIVLVKRAAITSRSESFTHGQLTSSQMSFIGIGFRDEQTPELLPDTLTGSDDGSGGLLDALSDLVPDSVKNLF